MIASLRAAHVALNRSPVPSVLGLFSDQVPPHGSSLSRSLCAMSCRSRRPSHRAPLEPSSHRHLLRAPPAPQPACGVPLEPRKRGYKRPTPGADRRSWGQPGPSFQRHRPEIGLHARIRASAASSSTADRDRDRASATRSPRAWAARSCSSGTNSAAALFSGRVNETMEAIAQPHLAHISLRPPLADRPLF